VHERSGKTGNHQGTDNEGDVARGAHWTALSVADARAEESRRSDRWFDDPLAEVFVTSVRGSRPSQDAPARPPEAEVLWDAWLQLYLPLRTRFFDAFLLAACGRGCSQVVLLASGLDARAYRLGWPEGIHLFEIDLPEAVEAKERILRDANAEARCARHAIAADLRDDWTEDVVEAGFRADLPTAWLAEGITGYLTDAENDDLVSRVGSLSAAGSELSLDLFDRVRRRRLVAALCGAGARDPMETTWQSTGPRDPSAWLASKGWLAREHDVAELAARYGRPLPHVLASAGPTVLYNRLLTARRPRP
jgi:methyltransferase (TIGR00027 family)